MLHTLKGTSDSPQSDHRRQDELWANALQIDRYSLVGTGYENELDTTHYHEDVGGNSNKYKWA